MRMIQYPDCPYCQNASTAMYEVDVEIGGIRLKGIQCNYCKNIVAYFKDYDDTLKELNERIDDLESKLDD